MTDFSIEDATPIDDISDLLLPWVKTRQQLNEVEAKKTAWPEQTLSTENRVRKEYIAAMKKADLGDYSALVDLAIRYSL